MSWQKKPGHEHDHICGRTLQHHIHLFNSVTGAEHNLHLRFGLYHCAACKRPFHHADIGSRDPSQLDPGAELEQALAMLNPNHEAILEYSKRHNVPILLGDLATTVPGSHRLVDPHGRRMLFPKKDEK